MLELKGLGKNYIVSKEAYPALKNINLAFPKTGFVAILGPSGCGKTTLLNLIGGLDRATSGDILIEGQSTKDFKNRDWDAYRNEWIGFVFQNYNLIPHLSAQRNIEISLMLNGKKAKERKARSAELLKEVEMEGEAKKRPNQLSGGQCQRVAIARALANDPKIILADEPTGALDSVSSVNAMESLKKISSNRLVIMVTHNRDLAERYADRIIEMKDGEIVSDTNPLPFSTEPPAEAPIQKKTSMSLWTALRTSVSNLRTKKGRSILTAVASSIGIIGVALVLSITNGFQIYVNNVEGQMASSVPISVTKSTYSYKKTDQTEWKKYPKESELIAYDNSSTATLVHTNYFTKDYLDFLENLKKNRPDLLKDYLVNYNQLDFNIITAAGLETENDFIKINQYNSAGSLGGAISAVTSLPATLFHPLYGDSAESISKGEGDYDLIYGEYPSEPGDLALIVDRFNRVSLGTLKALGIIPESAEGTSRISFKDIVEKKEYRAYRSSDFYDLDNPFHFQKNAYRVDDVSLDGDKVRLSGEVESRDFVSYEYPNLYNPETLKNFYNDQSNNPIPLKIKGILRPGKSSFLELMPASIGYLPSLRQIFLDDVQSDKCKPLQQAATEGWFIPESAPQGSGYANGLAYMEAQIQKIYDLRSVFENRSDFSENIDALADSLFSALSMYSFNISDDKIVIDGYPHLLTEYGFLNYARKVGADFREDLITEMIDKIQGGGDDATAALVDFMSAVLNKDFYSSKRRTYDPSSKLYPVDYNLVDFIACFESYSTITSILIFPSSLTTKNDLKAELDRYNEQSGLPENHQIVYSDVMSDFTDSLGVLIKVVSVVLIIFAAISLVVSSIMMGIITYVSVIERTKEIGVYRACGARKIDVGRLFESECSIIGAAAGLLGVVLTWIMTFPLNAILSHHYPDYNLEHLARVSPWHALILVALGIFLAFISGLFPARFGANKNPVDALRSE